MSNGAYNTKAPKFVVKPARVLNSATIPVVASLNFRTPANKLTLSVAVKSILFVINSLLLWSKNRKICSEILNLLKSNYGRK